MIFALRVDLARGASRSSGRARTARFPSAWTPDHSRVVLGDGYTAGDTVLYEPDGRRRAPCPVRDADRGARAGTATTR